MKGFKKVNKLDFIGTRVGIYKDNSVMIQDKDGNKWYIDRSGDNYNWFDYDDEAFERFDFNTTSEEP